MGLQLPGALTEPLGWIGMIWPEADEDKLFAAGQRWIAFAGQLRQVAQPANRAAAGVREANKGEAVDAFEAWWTGAEGPKAHLEDDALAAEIIGAALIAFAVLTLALKIAFIAQLVILLIEVTQAIATAIASLGATTAEIPGFIAATRAVCKRLVKQVVEHVQTFLKDLFERAKGLLRRFSREEGKAAQDLEKQLGIPAPLGTRASRCWRGTGTRPRPATRRTHFQVSRRYGASPTGNARGTGSTSTRTASCARHPTAPRSTPARRTRPGAARAGVSSSWTKRATCTPPRTTRWGGSTTRHWPTASRWPPPAKWW
jgi:hypothetical protein